MEWIDSKTFLRELKDRDPKWSTNLYEIILGIIFVFPWFYIIWRDWIHVPKVKRFIRKNIYDVEDTTSEILFCRTENNKYGLIWCQDNSNMSIKLKPIYDEIRHCEEEIYIVRIGKNYGLVNENKFILPITYQNIEYISCNKYRLDNNDKKMVNSHGERIHIH